MVESALITIDPDRRGRIIRRWWPQILWIRGYLFHPSGVGADRAGSSGEQSITFGLIMMVDSPCDFDAG